MRKILALDPGKTTGWAVGVVDNDRFFICYDQLQANERQLDRMLTGFWPTDLIYEDFDYRSRVAHADLTPMALIGVIRLFVQTSARCKDYPQKPSGAVGPKAYFNDNRLKELGIYRPSVEHGRDALRHLLKWFTFGAGYELNKPEKILTLVEEPWLFGAYFNHNYLWR